MSEKPSRIVQLTPGLALGAPAHRGWAACWNWVISCFAHLEGDGCEIDNLDGGRPTIKVKLEQGPGIKLTRKGNVWRIALASEDDDDAGDDVNTGTASGGGGGQGGGGEGGGGNTGSGSTATGSGGGSSVGGGTSSAGGTTASAGSDCNQWTDQPDNDDGDAGMENSGDSCEELNGW